MNKTTPTKDKRKKILLDCDTGVDDALAILLALGSDTVSLEGITTVHGNSPIEQTTTNTLRLLDFLDKDIPVAKGCEKPLALNRINAGDFHGSDGLGDSNLLPNTSNRKYQPDAIKFIIDKVKDGVRTLVATGPLTNIARAFETDPKTMSLLDELIIMGGSIYVPGNIDKLSEFNFYVDPHAADYVMQQKIKKILIPLDVTRKVILTKNDLEKLPKNKKSDLIKSISKKYREAYMKFTNLPGNPLHDPLAMGYAIDPGFVELISMNLKIESEGKYTRGTCVPELRSKNGKEPNVHVALKVDSKRFLDYFLNTVANEK